MDVSSPPTEDSEPDFPIDAAGVPPTGGAPSTGEILRFALPLMLGLLTTAINTLVDTIFIGRLGTASLAAVPMASFVYLIGWVLLIGVMRNSIAFTARAYGGRRYSAIGPILAHYHLLALAGLPLMLAFVRAWPAFSALGRLSPEVSALSWAYLEVRAWDIFFTMIFWLYTAFYQSTGNSRFPMAMSMGVVAVNIALDYALIFGHWGLPALGVRGSALATVIAYGLGAGAIVAASHLGRHRRRFGLRLFIRPQGARLREILRVGLPQGVGDCVELSTWTGFILIVGRLGEAPLAASNIGIQVTHLIFMPGFAFGIAASSYIGRFLGAGNRSAARATAGRVLVLGVGYMGLMGVPLWFFGEGLAGLFTTDARVIGLAGLMFKVMAAYQMVDGAGFITRVALGGAGDTRVPTLALAACALGVMFPAAWVLSRLIDPPLVGAWLGAFAYMAVFALAMQVRFHGGRWMDIRIGEAQAIPGGPEPSK